MVCVRANEIREQKGLSCLVGVVVVDCVVEWRAAKLEKREPRKRERERNSLKCRSVLGSRKKARA